MTIFLSRDIPEFFARVSERTTPQVSSGGRDHRPSFSRKSSPVCEWKILACLGTARDLVYQDSNGRRDISFSFSSHPPFSVALSRCDPSPSQTLRHRNLAFVKSAFSKSIFAPCWNHRSSISYYFRRSIDWDACSRLSRFDSTRNPLIAVSLYYSSFHS